MESEYQNVKCDIFRDAEAIIKKTDAKIKETRDNKERQYYAQDILLEAETLLSCSNYNAQNPDCTNCHSILLKFIQEYEHLANDKKINITK